MEIDTTYLSLAGCTIVYQTEQIPPRDELGELTEAINQPLDLLA